MNTKTLTTPSPKLKKHMQALRRDGELLAHDVKNQVADGLHEIKAEANTRLRKARDTASHLQSSVKTFTTEHSMSVFGLGLAAGVVLATWHKK